MKIGHVIVPGDDLGAQIGFYESLGLTTRFRDGDRYAAVTDGTVTLGLADQSQQPAPDQVVVSIEVEDLDACLADLAGLTGLTGSATAAAQPGEPVVGPHERRAVVLDPAGNPVALYERLA